MPSTWKVSRKSGPIKCRRARHPCPEGIVRTRGRAGLRRRRLPSTARAPRSALATAATGADTTADASRSGRRSACRTSTRTAAFVDAKADECAPAALRRNCPPHRRTRPRAVGQNGRAPQQTNGFARRCFLDVRPDAARRSGTRSRKRRTAESGRWRGSAGDRHRPRIRGSGPSVRWCSPPRRWSRPPLRTDPGSRCSGSSGTSGRSAGRSRRSRSVGRRRRGAGVTCAAPGSAA